MPPKNKKKKSKTPEQKAEAEARRKQANRQANMERSGPTPHDLGEEKKEEGNAALAAGDLPGAIALYTQAIQHDHSNHVYWSNRSAALLKQGNVKGAISDAEMCVEMNPGWGKGYARLGTAQFQNGEAREAEKTYKEGLLYVCAPILLPCQHLPPLPPVRAPPLCVPGLPAILRARYVCAVRKSNFNEPVVFRNPLVLGMAHEICSTSYSF